MQPATPAAAELMVRGAAALAAATAAGVRIDVPYLEGAMAEVRASIKEIDTTLRASEEYGLQRRRFGDKTNLSSRDQLAHVLYKEQGHKPLSWTAGGDKKERRPQVNDAALQAVGTPYCIKFLEREKLAKLEGTYLRGVARETVDGYLHNNFRLDNVVTYRGCVARGTPIRVAGYDYDVPIEYVRTGDIVYSYNGDGKLVTRRVLWAGMTGYKRVLRLHWENRVGPSGHGGTGGYVDLTPEHLVRLPGGGYIEARLLCEGQPLVADGNHKITRVEWIGEDVDVYDIEVEDTHNFIANEICVHNSSSDLNFQNIPIRNKLIARYIRRAFVPRPGRRLLEIDLKQNEVRISCCYSGDRRLIKDVLEGDMHLDMAAECFMLPTARAKPLRQLAKGVFVFAEFYGSYYVDVARSLWDQAEGTVLDDGTDIYDHLAAQGIRERGACTKGERREPAAGTFEAHIKQVEDRFWGERYNGYDTWRQEWWRAYLRQGWFRTLTGFSVAFGKNGPLRKNECINSPIQGSAFHCLLWGFIRLHDWLRANKMKSLIVAQIHDSILIDATEDEWEDVAAKIRDILVTDIRAAWPWLIMPLDIEYAAATENWFDKKKIDL